MSIFIQKHFFMNSGGKTHFKIECDGLTNEDWITLTKLISKKYHFKKVFGIPTGGIKLAKLLNIHYKSSKSDCILIVDDVLTTSRSMEEKKKELINDLNIKEENIFGVVIFSRGICPDWIKPIFQMWSD